MTGILKEKERVTLEIAQKIFQVLKVLGASTWITIQADYDAWHAKKRQIS